MKPTMTRDQAAVRVDEVVRQAHAALPAGAQLKQDYDTTMPCDDPSDLGPAGRVFVEKQHQVVYPESWPVEQALPTLSRYWEHQGYRVVKDLRHERDPRLSVEDPDDGFRVGIEVYPRPTGRADVYLYGSSPCIWEHGAPDPE